MNENKEYYLFEDNIQRNLSYIYIDIITEENPDQAAAYVLANVVLHNIEIGQKDIMYNNRM